ncbi:MAG: GAF domain-containing protein [Thermoguttaceae bacterium]|nr:GAF domain-containing protein [Thermoguttaceae bacterium]
MPKPCLNYLKIYHEQTLEARRPDIDNVASLSALVAAFRTATGWQLNLRRGTKPTHPSEHASSAPANPGVGASLGHALLDPVRSASAALNPPVDRQSAEQLAQAIAGLIDEHLQTQQALWEREAELAAAVPVVARLNSSEHLASRLQWVLRTAAQAVGCHAAGLYLLDEGTTSLKLRACWGLPRHRLTEPPRPLQETLADLEAMLGHAVCLEDVRLLSHWKPPEDFPSAACVPVSSSSTILGTLWVFSKNPRKFDDRDTSILEATAGRLAAELEREALLREGIEASQLKRSLVEAEQFQRAQFPSTPPVLVGWEVAGWVAPTESLNTAFFDWFPIEGAKLGACLGRSAEEGIAGALAAASLRASVRAHASQCRRPSTLIQRTNTALWTASPGGPGASLFGATLDPSGDLPFCLAGPLHCAILTPRGCSWCLHETPPLGESCDTKYRQRVARLWRGDALLVLACPKSEHAAGCLSAVEKGLLEAYKTGSTSAQNIACMTGEIFDTAWHLPKARLAVLAIKRTGS